MTSFLDKTRFVAIFIVLMLLPIVSHAGGLGMALLVFILGVLGLVLAIKTDQFKITSVQIALIVFLVWLSATAFWSPYRPDDLLTNYLKLFLMVIVFYWSRVLFEYTSDRHLRKLQHLFMAMMFFTAGILIIDLLSNLGLTLLFNPADGLNEKIFRIIDTEMNLGHSITILVLLAAPAALLMRARLPSRISRPAMALLFILTALAAWLNGLTVGLLGVIAVTVAAIAGYIYPRWTPKILLSLAIAFIMLAPLLAFFASNYTATASTELPLSWDHRLRMWGYCWQVILEHPLGGAGFDASRTFDETFIAKDGREITTVSLHPHNAGVQIWTETGLIGALLASMVIATLFKPVQNFVQNRSHSAAVSGIIIATILISSLTYGAWQFWWWGCVFFAVGTLYFLPMPENIPSLDDNQRV